MVTDKLDKLEKFVGIAEDEGEMSGVEEAEEEEQEAAAVDSSSSASSDGSIDVAATKKKPRRRRKRAGNWARRIADLEDARDEHETKIGDVKGETNRISEDVADLYSKLKSKDELDSEAQNRQDEFAKTQNDMFETLEQRLDTNEEHLKLLEQHDTEQDTKIDALEKADTFLQGVHQETAVKASDLENIVKSQAKELDEMKNTVNDYIESKGIQDESLVKNVENLTHKQSEIFDKFDNLEEALEKNANEIREKTSELLNATKEDQIENIQDTKLKIDDIEGLIKKMENDMQNLHGTASNNANDIKVLLDNEGKFNDRLGHLEVEAQGIAGELSERIAESKGVSGDLLQEVNDLKIDIAKTGDKLKEFDEKTEAKLLAQMNSIQDKLEDNHSQFEKFTSDSDKKMQDLETKANNNAKKIEEGNNVIKNNTEQLIPLLPLIEDVSEKFDKAFADLKVVDGRQQAAIDDLKKNMISTTADIEDMEDKLRNQEEKLFGLEEQNVQAQEKVTFVEALRSDLHAMDEKKQQSEAKLKEDMDMKASELRDIINKKLEDLEDKTNDHDSDLHNIKNKQNELDVIVGNLNGVQDEHVEKLRDILAVKESMKHNKEAIEKLNNDLKSLPQEVERNVKARVVDHVNDMRGLIDDKLDQVDKMTKDNEKHVENLRDLNERLLKEMKKQLQDDIEDQKQHMEEIKSENTQDISKINEKIEDILDQLANVNRDEIKSLMETRDDIEVKIKDLKEDIKDASKDLKEKVEGRLDKSEQDIVNLNELVVNVQQDVGEVASNVSQSQHSIKNIRKYRVNFVFGSSIYYVKSTF